MSKRPTVGKWAAKASICICRWMYMLWYQHCLAVTKDTTTLQQQQNKARKHVYRSKRCVQSNTKLIPLTSLHSQALRGICPTCVPHIWLGTQVPQPGMTRDKGVMARLAAIQWCAICTPRVSHQWFRNALSSILSHVCESSISTPCFSSFLSVCLQGTALFFTFPLSYLNSLSLHVWVQEFVTCFRLSFVFPTWPHQTCCNRDELQIYILSVLAFSVSLLLFPRVLPLSDLPFTRILTFLSKISTFPNTSIFSAEQWSHLGTIFKD